MKKFEHEGKRYVEYNTVLSIVLTALVCFVVGFIVLIIILVVRADQIYSDPLNYGARIYNVSYCTCHINETSSFNFDSKRIWKNVDNPGLNLMPDIR